MVKFTSSLLTRKLVLSVPMKREYNVIYDFYVLCCKWRRQESKECEHGVHLLQCAIAQLIYFERFSLYNINFDQECKVFKFVSLYMLTNENPTSDNHAILKSLKIRFKNYSHGAYLTIVMMAEIRIFFFIIGIGRFLYEAILGVVQIINLQIKMYDIIDIYIDLWKFETRSYSRDLIFRQITKESNIFFWGKNNGYRLFNSQLDGLQYDFKVTNKGWSSGYAKCCILDIEWTLDTEL
ncbi:hypothetical protein AGLY_016172 [Aphis glycines]|uniref:Uncharacterized protein n=1 Tax=Aphis glycines TaxID=307491 RepID=A0A6G0SYZ4_APHGL|nr:hypothetical protein AGLY_016172 [Aphis glycines]